MSLLHAEVAVIAWRGAVLALVNALDAMVGTAALGADSLVGATARGVAEALAVVALPGSGRRRCRRPRRRGGGPRSLARLGLCLAGVLGPPTPLAALRRIPAVFP